MRKWPRLPLWLVGQALTALGLVALVVLVGRDLLTWYAAVSPDQQKYLAQRILYVLGTNTDLPVVQVLVAGVALRLAAGRRQRGASRAGAAPRPAEGLW
jgi:hypothetical protein